MRGVVTAVACGVALVSVTLAGDGTIAWETDARKALAAAEDRARPVVVDVWAVWCQPCREMDARTWSAPAIVSHLEDRFVPLKVDADVDDVFTARYRAGDQLPTTLVLDDRGDELARFAGFVDATTLGETLDRVVEGYATYVERRDARKDADALAWVGGYLLDLGNAERAEDLLARAVRHAREAPDARRQAIELRLAEARLDLGRSGRAEKRLAALAESGATPGIRTRAQALLAR